jgi:hypothetical protein
MSVPSSKFDDYTVGLISALPSELAAVRAMMDECHGRPSDTAPADSNSYFLGRISEHNVVAACLPSGAPGTVSAATVAAHMQLTFKSIRFGLAIGVGSGVPNASNDIRLGDVIVSAPKRLGRRGAVRLLRDARHRRLRSDGRAEQAAAGASDGADESEGTTHARG